MSIFGPGDLLDLLDKDDRERLHRKGDRVEALACTRLITCGMTYEVAEDQRPGEPVRLQITPLLDVTVDGAILRETYD